MTNKDIDRILEAVGREMGISSEEILMKKRKAQLVKARMLVVFVAFLADEKNDRNSLIKRLGQSCFTVRNYLIRAFDEWNISKEWRETVERVMTKIGEYDRYKQFASARDSKIIGKTTGKVAERPSARADNKAKGRSKAVKLFHFTAEEEARILRAKRNAFLFMQTIR